MRSLPGTRPLLSALAVGLALVLASCGASTPSASPAPAATAGLTSAPATPPEPTEVPGGQTPGAAEPGGSVEPPVTTIPTTQTDWGEILDALPDGFPVFPDAAVAESPAEPASGAFIASAGVDEVATWYRDALEATGKSTLDLSSPLEDGSRVLDMQGDLPECRVRLTFRPEGGSTMITVLVAAGCAGGGG